MLKIGRTKSTIAWYTVGFLAAINITFQLVASIHNASLIAKAKPAFLFLAVLSQLLAYIVVVPGFRSFMNKHSIHISFLPSLIILLSGLGVSKVIPAGEYLVWRQRLKRYPSGVGASTEYIVLFYVWNLAGLIFLFIVSEILASVFSPSREVGLLARYFAVVPIFFSLVIVSLVIASRFKSVRAKLSQFFVSRFGTSAVAPQTIIKNNKLGLRELGWLSFGAIFTWILEAVTLLLCLMALGQTPPLLVTLFGYCFARLFIIVPLFPGGVGEVETATTLFFASYGFPLGPVFTATVLFRLLTYWLPIIFGITSFFVGKQKSNHLEKVA